MQLSAVADLRAATWDVAVDGRWLGAGPENRTPVEFDAIELDASGSARLIVLWLENGDAYSFAAVRSGNAKGQDKDLISVGLPASEASHLVFDPRLSTEYGPTGVPRRFGIELWVGEDEDGDQHPRRLAGEAGSLEPALIDGLVRVHPMQVHAEGVPGLGLYLLVAR